MNLLAILIALGNFFFSGFVFMKIWNWFPSLIFGLPSVGYAAGLGLVLLVILVRSKNLNIKEEKTGEEKVGEMLAITVFYGLVLGLGFIISPYI